METERKTLVQPERLPSPKAGLDPARFFANKDRLSRLCIGIALANTIVTLSLLGLVQASSQRAVQFVVLDPNGNTIIAPGAPFQEATELHLQQALQATSALLNRHPKDFDQPEVLKALFSRVAFAQANQLKTAEAGEFEERQIEQKCHVTRVDAIGTRQGEVQVQVTGELARWGRIQGVPFVDSVPFILRLDLQFNADLLSNRRQPTLVKHFTLTYEASPR
ncbi:MAG: hypothetical protein AB7O66_22625 [Limisphaerales bacterium]